MMCSWSQTNANDDTSALHSGGELCVSSGHVIYPTPTPTPIILGQNRTGAAPRAQRRKMTYS